MDSLVSDRSGGARSAFASTGRMRPEVAMGRGLGTLQRAILESLVPSKRLHAIGVLNYRGGNYGTDTIPPAAVHQGRIGLPDGVFDVRAVKALLISVYGESSRQYCNTYQTTPAFDVAFSRAIRTLSWRGILVRESYAVGHRERRLVTCPGGAPQDVTITEVRQAIASAEAKLKAPMPIRL
jgi:hypothetical protein